ncbi:hypothetical protein QT969_01240 [Rhodococcus sp. CSLK01-03]|uniref:Uncharacterized protein n=1 Tax=Rhodococcus indonesiensis TaxID=3055869 RepID=A0ABT7RGY2_9NOCA|nr:hypothetical protein [Rhodococcus indonesiensis]MDM7486902.1 hypothetical protein [Rhodococcus indonesiensis]
MSSLTRIDDSRSVLSHVVVAALPVTFVAGSAATTLVRHETVTIDGERHTQGWGAWPSYSSAPACARFGTCQTTHPAIPARPPATVPT